MKYVNDRHYHIYNRGNNKQQIFFCEANYLLFLEKIRKFIYPNCDILSYSLIPSQFNFLIHSNSDTIINNDKGYTYLSEGIKNLLSSYCKAINIQESRTGSLFTQNTWSRMVDETRDQLLRCFIFTHQIPLKTGLVIRPEDWKFSSYRDYIGLRNGSLCNRSLLECTLKLTQSTIREMTNRIIPNELLSDIFEKRSVARHAKK